MLLLFFFFSELVTSELGLFLPPVLELAGVSVASLLELPGVLDAALPLWFSLLSGTTFALKDETLLDFKELGV